MTEKAGDVDTPNGMNSFGPDYFRYYVSQVKDLIEDDFVPSTESRCGEGCLAGNKGARMEALLRQAVTALSPEVEERLQSVLHTCWLHSVVRKQREAEGAAVEGGAGPIQNKRLKTSAPLSPTSILASPMPGLDNNVALPEGGIPNGVKKHCARCGKTNARKWRDEAEGKFLCDACGSDRNNESKSGVATGSYSVKADDLRFFLGLESSVVDDILKKHTNELFSTLAYMEKQLEELLDAVESLRRPMKLHEKQQLQRRIQKLSPRNLNRVAEIVQRNKPADQCFDEIFVDLEHQDEVTLQRLYYYVEAVEKGVNHEHDSLNVKGEKYTRDLQYLEHLQTRR